MTRHDDSQTPMKIKITSQDVVSSVEYIQVVTETNSSIEESISDTDKKHYSNITILAGANTKQASQCVVEYVQVVTEANSSTKEFTDEKHYSNITTLAGASTKQASQGVVSNIEYAQVMTETNSSTKEFTDEKHYANTIALAAASTKQAIPENHYCNVPTNSDHEYSNMITPSRLSTQQ